MMGRCMILLGTIFRGMSHQLSNRSTEFVVVILRLRIVQDVIWNKKNIFTDNKYDINSLRPSDAYMRQ